jgi:phosphoesterase RecJ-like protein
MHPQFYERLLTRLLGAGEKFLVTTHRNPDPDGIGAQIGLEHLFRTRSLDCLVVNQDSIHPRYSYLDPEKRIYALHDRFDRRDLEERIIVMVDNSEPARSGELNRLVNDNWSNLIIIDHHDGFEADMKTHFLNPDAGSTSEMIFELLKYADAPLTLEVARALYAGIVIDTGHFRYRKTAPRTHEIAAQLLALGVDPAEMAELLLSSWRIGRLAGRALLYRTMQVREDLQVAWFAIRRADLDAVQASPDDIDGIVNELIEPERIKVGILFTEREGGETRASMRSKGDVNLLPAAERYGGGGHKNACGATIPLDLERAVAEFIPVAAACVN